MRFKLVKTGRSYAGAEESTPTAEGKFTPDRTVVSVPPFTSETRNIATVSSGQDVYYRVMNWANHDPKRWHRVHNSLLRIYAPSWGRRDGRDALVSWAAAHLALTRAQRELKRLDSLRRPLTRRELDTRGGRQADMSFWGRLARRMAPQIPVALAEDVEAREVLLRLIRRKDEKDKCHD